MSERYVPTDSPFGAAMCAWLGGEFDGREYSLDSLDEFVQVATSLVDRPCYAGDERLADWQNTLWWAREQAIEDLTTLP